MKTFKQHLKEQAHDEMIAEASLLDVQNNFVEVDLEVIEPTEPSEHENKKRFRFTAKTRKGTSIDMTMGISELLHPTFVIGLQRLSAS
ncbi:hypothetical protein [Vibrio sp. Isolate30]|uniref:hypothetical protein n=1 Tax=unclassified Vibrio TaxID=2614977 RepID=UPI001EFE7F0D|nr:hypothetical protein [Vibrio sp. Isolate30]MCG9630150.1 hypothetical protein [Vibrio sp. Isolate30]